MLTAAILGPAQRRVNATVGDLPSGQAGFCRSNLRRLASVKKRWQRDACLSACAISEFDHGIWEPTRLMEVASFWRGYWSVTFSRTFLSLIAATRHKVTSHENSRPSVKAMVMRSDTTMRR